MLARAQSFTSLGNGHITFDRLLLDGAVGSGCFVWNMATWFWDYGAFAALRATGRYPALRILTSQVNDASPHWQSLEHRTVVCATDQRLLLSDGNWRTAGQLAPGDRLQHFCGNGHETPVLEIVPVGEVEMVSFTVPEFGACPIGGIIVEAVPAG